LTYQKYISYLDGLIIICIYVHSCLWLPASNKYNYKDTLWFFFPQKRWGCACRGRCAY